MTYPIYFVIPGDIDSLTGGYGYDRRLLSELNRLGFAVQLLSLASSFPQADADDLRDAELKFASLPEGAVVLVDCLALGAMDNIAQRHRQRLKLIALCHHPLALEVGLGPEQSQALQRSEQRALAAARAVIVTSHNTARLLSREFAVPESKITVALPGTDKQSFAACVGNPPLLLTVATLTQRKAHDLLIDALALIADLPWQARFVGGKDFDSAWTAYLHSKLALHAIEDRITLVGNVADLSGEYMQADLFVLPSLFEGYGMAFAEALSFGLPVVAVRNSAVADLIPESAGMLVPAATIPELAQTLRYLLIHSSRRKELQLGAQQASRALPEWTDTAQVIAQLIQQVSSYD